MTQILNSEITTDLKFVVDILAHKNEYEPFKEKITEQILKNVEVKGFRKGNAPRNLALEKIDQLKLQTTILTESVEKFYSAIQPEILKLIEEKQRVAIQTSAQLEADPKFTKETEEGLQFRISILLLPEVDLDSISNLELDDPSTNNLPDRLSFDEFKTREEKAIISKFNKYQKTNRKSKSGDKLITNILEKDKSSQEQSKQSDKAEVNLGQNRFPPKFEEELTGVKAGQKKKFDLHLQLNDESHRDYEYEIEVLEVQEPVYTELSQVIENNPEAKEKVKSVEEFESLLKSIYDGETNQILQNLRQRLLIRTIVEKVPDFDLPQEAIKAEVDRINEVIKAQSEAQKISISESFRLSGLPGSENPPNKDKEVFELVKSYVLREFKLVEIFRTIYYSKLDKKITKEDLEQVKSRIKQEPQKYKVKQSEIDNDNRLTDIAFDRLLRDRAFKWILERTKFKTPDNSKEDKAKKIAKTKSAKRATAK